MVAQRRFDAEAMRCLPVPEQGFGTVLQLTIAQLFGQEVEVDKLCCCERRLKCQYSSLKDSRSLPYLILIKHELRLLHLR